MQPAYRRPPAGSESRSPSLVGGCYGWKPNSVSNFSRGQPAAHALNRGRRSRFREHAARVCAEIDIARETILPAGDLRGRLRIAAPLSLGPTSWRACFAEMARRHPLLHLHACYGDRFVDNCRGRLRLCDTRRLSQRLEPDRASRRTHLWKARRRARTILGSMGTRDPGRTLHA